MSDNAMFGLKLFFFSLFAVVGTLSIANTVALRSSHRAHTGIRAVSTPASVYTQAERRRDALRAARIARLVRTGIPHQGMSEAKLIRLIGKPDLSVMKTSCPSGLTLDRSYYPGYTVTITPSGNVGGILSYAESGGVDNG